MGLLSNLRRIPSAERSRGASAKAQFTWSTADIVVPEAGSRRLATDSTDISRRVFGPENPLTASSVYNLGAIEARRGNRPQALSLLRQAVDHRLPPSDALAMENDPDLKSLHSDARFIAMVANVKQRAAAAPKSAVRY